MQRKEGDFGHGRILGFLGFWSMLHCWCRSKRISRSSWKENEKKEEGKERVKRVEVERERVSGGSVGWSVRTIRRNTGRRNTDIAIGGYLLVSGWKWLKCPCRLSEFQQYGIRSDGISSSQHLFWPNKVKKWEKWNFKLKLFDFNTFYTI